MNALLKSVHVVTLFVEDLARSRSFYLDVFDAPVVFEDQDSVVFAFDGLLINLLTGPAARELIEPAVVAGPEAGSRFQLTIRVADVDAVCGALASRGVALVNGPVDRPWGVRTACFRDPAGHLWEVAQDRDTAPGG